MLRYLRMRGDHTVPHQTRLIRLDPGSELVRQLEAAEAAGEPLEVDTGSHRSALYINRLEQPENIWAGYDSDRVQRALAKSAGALKGMDIEQLLHDLAEQREQDDSHERLL